MKPVEEEEGGGGEPGILVISTPPLIRSFNKVVITFIQIIKLFELSDKLISIFKLNMHVYANM